MIYGIFPHMFVTHTPTGHTARVEICKGRNAYKAKALALEMIKGKIWASPRGTEEISAINCGDTDFSKWGDRGANSDALREMVLHLEERVKR